MSCYTSLKRTKIGPKSIKSIFIGYASNSKAYRFWIWKIINIAFVTISAELFENKTIKDANSINIDKGLFNSIFKDLGTNKLQNTNLGKDDPTNNIFHHHSETSEPDRRQSKRKRLENNFGPGMITYDVGNIKVSRKPCFNLPDAS